MTNGRKLNPELTSYQIKELQAGFGNLEKRFDIVDGKLTEIHEFIQACANENKENKNRIAQLNGEVTWLKRGAWAVLIAICVATVGFIWEQIANKIFHN